MALWELGHQVKLASSLLCSRTDRRGCPLFLSVRMVRSS